MGQGRLDLGVSRAPRPAPGQTAPTRRRPDGWRAPTAGEHVCAGCVGAAVFGLGETWFCRACVPAGFLSGGEGSHDAR